MASVNGSVIRRSAKVRMKQEVTGRAQIPLMMVQDCC